MPMKGSYPKSSRNLKNKYYYNICGLQCFDDTVFHEFAGMIRVQHYLRTPLTRGGPRLIFFFFFLNIYITKKKIKRERLI